jgi:hypothetical protein
MSAPLLRRTALALGLAAGQAWAADLPVQRVRLPREPKAEEGRRQYPTQLLELALRAAGVRPELVLSSTPMNQARSLIDLADPKREIDIAWTMTSVDMERQLLPIRVPLFKGLYGWRVLLVRKGMSQAFAEVRTLAQLQRFTMVQGAQWPDTEILRHNGLKVLTTMQFGELFNRLEEGRAHAIPRSVVEVGWELENYSDRCELEPALLLHYPAAMYFFVNPAQTQLAELIETGLRRLHASGVFEEQFRRFAEPKLAALGLARRRVIELENPLLPRTAPLARKSWWFSPV